MDHGLAVSVLNSRAGLPQQTEASGGLNSVRIREGCDLIAGDTLRSEVWAARVGCLSAGTSINASIETRVVSGRLLQMRTGDSAARLVACLVMPIRAR